MAPKAAARKSGEPSQDFETKDDAFKDECVKYGWDCIWKGLELHIREKAIYPRVVAHAVAFTVAQMVQMVCYASLVKMDNWDHPIKGQHLEEWDPPEECQLPPIDAWARQVIPMEMKRPPPPTAFSEHDFMKSLQHLRQRKMSVDVLHGAAEDLARRRNSTALIQLQVPRRHSEPAHMANEAMHFYEGVLKPFGMRQIFSTPEPDKRESNGKDEKGEDEKEAPAGATTKEAPTSMVKKSKTK